MQLGDNAQPKKSWVLSCLDSNLKSGSIPPQPKKQESLVNCQAKG